MPRKVAHIERKRIIPKARLQGSLDGLCGVYAIINSLILMEAMRSDFAPEVFEALCKKIDKKAQRLFKVLVGGMEVRELGRLVDEAFGFVFKNGGPRLTREIAFNQKDIPLAEAWDRIHDHVRLNGPGSAIISLGGIHNHWTCVRAVSEGEIRLQDSDGLRTLKRSNCTTSANSGRRGHTIWPNQIYLLTNPEAS